jgi:hypothetical protein
MKELEIGDLVKDTCIGKIGIVIGHDPYYVNHYRVQFHDNICAIHTYNLKLLETK